MSFLGIYFKYRSNDNVQLKKYEEDWRKIKKKKYCRVEYQKNSIKIVQKMERKVFCKLFFNFRRKVYSGNMNKVLNIYLFFRVFSFRSYF